MKPLMAGQMLEVLAGAGDEVVESYNFMAVV
jgi:hypothetical protein